MPKNSVEEVPHAFGVGHFGVWKLTGWNIPATVGTDY
jgi:hypothetical protein